jgi:hypothetical protein
MIIYDPKKQIQLHRQQEEKLHPTVFKVCVGSADSLLKHEEEEQRNE